MSKENLVFDVFNIDSFTPGRISNSANEEGENGKLFLIITLFITPSRSKNFVFSIKF